MADIELFSLENDHWFTENNEIKRTTKKNNKLDLPRLNLNSFLKKIIFLLTILFNANPQLFFSL
ncbi:MAG: hypothetical protein EAZ15_10000 [Sphingobacteriales bacterium]|nr:MAG: hypothetical protein EAZ15_10000 [Sphingobacteriales bacterium]